MPADTSASEGNRGYVSRLRAQQAADTRDRVVRAAADLFAERGYAGTTLPEIGRRAGVSTETVQDHGPRSSCCARRSPSSPSAPAPAPPWRTPSWGGS